MEAIPVELWEKIARYACIDGGYTGCSLSLVSHFIRDATRSSRYTSVALMRVDSCYAFADLLQHTDTRVVILHLFISPGSTTQHRPQWAALWRLAGVCTEILRHSAPTLLSLTLYEPVGFHIFDKGIHLPHLRDLSGPGADLPYRDPEVDSYICPAVERLHFNRCMNVRGARLYECIAALAPIATCVRFTGISEDVQLGLFVRAVIDVPFVDWEFDPMRPDPQDIVHFKNIAAHLPHIRSFIIQLQKYDGSGWCGTGAGRHGDMKWALEAIVRETGDRDPGARQLVLRQDAERYESAHALEDWLDVVRGGDGPWAPAAQASSALRAPVPLPLKSYKEMFHALLATQPPLYVTQMSSWLRGQPPSR